MKLVRIILFVAMCFGLVLSLNAQVVKSLNLSNGEAYTDHLSLSLDTRDMDMIVKIMFNEKENTLTLSLISYRVLFVFQDNVQYSKIIKHHKLRSDKLPYVVESDVEACYKVSKVLKQSLPKPRKKHLFQRWIEYSGLQPQPVDFKMVNDYIEQKFDIKNKGNFVSISLHDILLFDKNFKPGKKIYDVVHKQNIDRKYEINIHRDPCFEKEEEIAAAENRLQNINKSYSSLKQDSVKSSIEAVDVFNELKDMYVKQYPKDSTVSKCQQIQMRIDSYNSYVDSMQMAQCIYYEPVKQKKHLNHDYVLTMARRIDNSVARWKLTNDKAEKKDLNTLCVKIIDEVNIKIEDDILITPELDNAISIFIEAETYFNKICVDEL